MPPRPSVLLFDWDNTLVDGWAAITVALNAAFAAFGHPTWTIEDTRARVRVSLRESFPTMFGDRWTEARAIFFQALRERHLAHLMPLPGVPALLEACAAWPMGVVSNKEGGFLRREVTHLGWDRHFGPVIGAGDAAADKPAPDPILLALSRMGVRPDADVWYIGDTAVDMRAANAAGVTAVLLGNADHDGGVEHTAPDLHYPSAVDLSARLRELA